MKNKKIRVALGGRSYTISVAAGLLDGVREYIPNLAHFGRIALVTDENVEPLYAERLLRSFAPCNIPIDLFVVPAGEESKSPEVVATLWESFLDARLGRDGLVVALGGGWSAIWPDSPPRRLPVGSDLFRFRRRFWR